MNGRINASRTDGVLDTVREWTGDRPLACPWAAFSDPFVARVLNAYRYFEPGMVSVVEPHLSHRLLEGLTHYHYVDTRMTKKKWELEKEQRARGD